MNIDFAHVPASLYIGDFITGYKFPICSFSKTKKKDYQPFPNEPTSGFTFAGGHSYGSMIIDPRGFAFVVSNSDLFDILSHATIVGGEIIGEYRWIWNGGRFCIKKESIVKTMDILSEEEILDDVEFKGDLCKIYKLPNGDHGVYLGRCFSIEANEYNRGNNYGSKHSINDRKLIKEEIIKKHLLAANLTVSHSSSHVFATFDNSGNVYYMEYPKFVSFGDKGFSDIITPDNIEDYRIQLSYFYYKTTLKQFFVYDMDKYYCSLSKRYKNTMMVLSDTEIDDIVNIEPKCPVVGVDNNNNKYIGIMSADGSIVYRSNLSFSQCVTNGAYKNAIHKITIYGKKKQTFEFDLLNLQQL